MGHQSAVAVINSFEMRHGVVENFDGCFKIMLMCFVRFYERERLKFTW